MLARGRVLGGSSAGATILGSFLVRGDTKGLELMIGDHVEGMGFRRTGRSTNMCCGGIVGST